MSKRIEFGLPQRILTLNQHDMTSDVWTRRLRDELHLLFDVRLWCSSISKKVEVPPYRIYSCKTHEECEFKIKAVIHNDGQMIDVCVGISNLEIEGTEAGRSRPVAARSGFSRPGLNMK